MLVPIPPTGPGQGQGRQPQRDVFTNPFEHGRLVHFDDRRTTAMLEVLADISEGMQVILFTHHASVVAAARTVQTAKPDTVFLHGEAARS